MTTTPPPGARTNGLLATASWVRLGECDPRLTVGILNELAVHRIPAYAQPFAGEVGGYLDLRPPQRPMDRLFVDHHRHADAATLLQGRLGDGEPPQDHAVEQPPPGPEPHRDGPTGLNLDADTDALFAAIIADFHGPDGPQPTPSAEPIPRTHRPDPGLLDPGGLLYDSPLGAGRPPSDEDPFADDDEHFERPQVGPAPPLHTITRAALVAITAGVVLLLLPNFIELTDTEVSNALGALLVAAGAVALVLRLRDEPPDDHDDGAVV